MFKINKRVFLDYASTTPIDKKVLKAMKPYFMDNFANPSGLYKEALVAKKALEESRESVAKLTQSKPGEVIFTGSGTESDNLAILGVARAAYKKYGKELKNEKPHIITTAIEHIAVMESFAQLEKEGFDVTYLIPESDGRISIDKFKRELCPETILCSVILVNNEIGTIEPVREISVVIDRFKKEQNRAPDSFPFFHTDASQAPNYLDVNINKLGADLMVLDGSKIYGPKGVSCLIKKSFVPIEPISFGGKQELELRPATENIPNIVGFAKALEIAKNRREKDSESVHDLQKYFIEKIESEIPDAKINGSIKWRIPNNINICLPGLNSEFAVIQLDEKGIGCSSMSACTNLSDNARSYVVDALGDDCGGSSLRFSLGRENTKKDIDLVVTKLKEVINIQSK